MLKSAFISAFSYQQIFGLLNYIFYSHQMVFIIHICFLNKFYHPDVYTGKRKRLLKVCVCVCVCVVKSTVLHYKDV